MKNFLREYMPYLVALLPLLMLRDFTPDTELKYVSLARECIREGHFFALTYQGEPYVCEPPLFVWLIALLKLTLRHNYMISIGLLSLLPAIGVLMVMNRWVERYAMSDMRLRDGSQSRSMASFMLFTTGLFLGQAFFVSPAMLMCFFISLSLYTFWRLAEKQLSYRPSTDITDRRTRRRLQWMLGVWLFLGTQSGGLMGFAVPFLSMVAYAVWMGASGRIEVSEALRIWDRASNWRTWLMGGALVALWATGLWYEGGYDYLRLFVGHQLFYPIFESVQHVRGWWYYLACIWVDTLPWGPVCILLLLHDVYRRLTHWHQTHQHMDYSETQTFFIVITLVTLTICSCSKGKLDVYFLPAYPFLIYAGVMQMKHHGWPVRLCWTIVWTCRVLLLIVFVGGLLMPWLNPYIGSYGRICYRANHLRRSSTVKDVYIYDLRRTKGMDVYLHLDPRQADAHDIAAGSLSGSLLIMRESDLGRLGRELDFLQVADSLRGRVVDSYGPYVILQYD